MSGTRNRSCVLLVAALGWVAAGESARAQDAPVDVEEAVDAIFAEDSALPPTDPAAERAAMARALFREGLAHAREGRYERAADLFQRAQALRPAPGIAYNLASAFARLGRLVEASELLQWVIRHPETSDGMRAAAQTSIDAIRPRLAIVHLVVRGPREGLDLLLDAAPLAYAAVGVDVPLDPGRHRFELARGEERVASREVELGEGERAELELAVPVTRLASSVVVVHEPAEAPPPTEDWSWLAWAGGALAVVVVGVVIGAIVAAAQSGAAEPIVGTTVPPFLEID